jgi:LuxR family maltose regulon positive regulatory protein
MLRSVAQWNLGLVEWLRGRLADAERALSSTSSQRRGIGERGLGVVMRDHLGQVQRARGQLDAARDTYQRTLAITAPPGGPVMPGAEAALVGQAEVAYERNDLDTALRHASEGIPLCRQFVYTPPLAAGLVRLAWIRQARGDPAGAREAVGEAGRVAPSPGVAGLLNPVPAQRARLAAAESQNRVGSVIEILVLRGLVLAAAGAEAAAVDALAQALTLACPQGYVRVFADEGAPMSALLARLVAAQKADQAAARGRLWRIPPAYVPPGDARRRRRFILSPEEPAITTAEEERQRLRYHGPDGMPGRGGADRPAARSGAPAGDGG